MRFKLAVFTSVFSMISPILAIIIMCFFEQEFAEAVLSGLLIGCLIGTVFGIISLFFNKGKSKLIKIISTIPMCPLVIYVLLLIPYFLYK